MFANIVACHPFCAFEMLYRNQIHLFSRLLGLIVAVPVYGLLYPISQNLLKLAIKENIHFKNRIHKYKGVAHWAQLYEIAYTIGSSIGYIIDSILCACMQPMFWLSEKLAGKEKTQFEINNVVDYCQKADQFLKTNIHNQISLAHTLLKIPALIITLSTPAVAILMILGTSFSFLTPLNLSICALGLSHGLVGLFERFIASRIKSQNSRVKKEQMIDLEAHEMNVLNALHFPGHYSEQNLADKCQDVIESIALDNGYYHDHEVISDQNKKDSKANKSNNQTIDSFWYKMGRDLGVGQREGFEIATDEFIKNGQMNQGTLQREPKPPVTFQGGTYRLRSFDQTSETASHLSRKDLADARSKLFKNILSSKKPSPR